MPRSAAPTEVAAAPLTATRQSLNLAFAHGGHLAYSTPANFASQDGCPELDMYTTESAFGGRNGRRVARPGGTPRAGPIPFAVSEQGWRGGQRVAETGRPRLGHAPLPWVNNNNNNQQQQQLLLLLSG